MTATLDITPKAPERITCPVYIDDLVFENDSITIVNNRGEKLIIHMNYKSGMYHALLKDWFGVTV